MLAVALFAVEQVSLNVSAIISHGQMAGPFLAYPIALVADFFIASYASHYLGKRPYAWTGIAVVSSYAGQAMIVLSGGLAGFSEDVHYNDPSVPHYAPYVFFAVAYLGSLGVCLAGVRYGRRRHDTFLAKKLERLQRKPPPQPPPPPQPGTDLFEQLKKLAELRDAGVITDDEFNEKKAQILARL
jgi:hypothetical protein